ncbi:unnamed protein product [Camellia sinensis]
MWKRQEVVQKCRRAKAGCSEISSEQGNLRMLMCQTLKFSSCSSVHHARSCMIVKGIQAGGAGHPIRGCRISWLRKFKHSRYRHPRQEAWKRSVGDRSSGSLQIREWCELS